VVVVSKVYKSFSEFNYILASELFTISRKMLHITIYLFTILEIKKKQRYLL